MSEIACPSGLRLSIRGMTVADEDMLTQVTRKMGRGGRPSDAVYRMVSNCVTGVVDPGPYPGMKAFAAKPILSVDMQYALMHVRGESWGDEVEVDGDCPNGHAASGAVPISKCQIRPPSQKALDAIRSQIPVPFTLPKANRRVEFWPLTVEIEEKAAAAIEAMPNEPSSETLVARIASVDGFDENLMDPETNVDVRTWVKQMASADAMALRRAMAEADGAIDTEVQIPCTECGAYAIADLIVTPDFFAPRAGRISFKRSTI